MNTEPSISVVITTIGREEALLRLLHSLGANDLELFNVSIAVQGGPPSLPARLERQATHMGLRCTVIQSQGGASIGRNDAYKALAVRGQYVIFPNDTTIYPANFMTRLSAILRIEQPRIAAFEVHDYKGPKFSLPRVGVPLDHKNVWRIILPGLVMSSQSFGDLGGFRADLGTGAHSPWQSGEETDIALRVLSRWGGDITWIHDIHVINPHDTYNLSTQQRRRKLRAYATGYGYLLRTHHYEPVWAATRIIGGLAYGVRHGVPYSPLDGVWVLTGRANGYFRILNLQSWQYALEPHPGDRPN